MEGRGLVSFVLLCAAGLTVCNALYGAQRVVLCEELYQEG